MGRVRSDSARQGRTATNRTGQGWAGQSRIVPDRDGPVSARQGGTGPSRAEQGRAGPNRTRQDQARPERTGQGLIGPDRVRNGQLVLGRTGQDLRGHGMVSRTGQIRDEQCAAMQGQAEVVGRPQQSRT